MTMENDLGLEIQQAFQAIEQAGPFKAEAKAVIDQDFDFNTQTDRDSIEKLKQAYLKERQPYEDEISRQQKIKGQRIKQLPDYETEAKQALALKLKPILTLDLTTDLRSTAHYPRGFRIPEVKTLFEFGVQRDLRLDSFLTLSEEVRAEMYSIRHHSCHYNHEKKDWEWDRFYQFPFAKKTDISASEKASEKIPEVNHAFTQAMYWLISSGASDWPPARDEVSFYAKYFSDTQTKFNELEKAYTDPLVFKTHNGFLSFMQAAGLNIYFEIAEYAFQPTPWSPP